MYITSLTQTREREKNNIESKERLRHFVLPKERNEKRREKRSYICNTIQSTGEIENREKKEERRSDWYKE